jgi:hypothetical protein
MSNPSLVRKLSQWLSGTTYNVGDVVWTSANGIQYPITCLVTHIAGTFATDVLSKYWQMATPMKNYLINSNFDFWQRATSQSLTSSNAYVADRWNWGTGSAGTSVISRQALSSNNVDLIGQGVQYCLQSSTSVAGTTPIHYQRVENVQSLAGKQVTLSFWARTSTGNGAYSVTPIFIQNFGSGGSTSVTTNGTAISVAETSGAFIKYTQTITIPSIAGLTVGTSSYLELRLATGNTFNGLIYQITQIMLNEGPVPAPFQLAGNSISGELALCQRYFEKSFEIDTVPSNGGGAFSTQVGLIAGGVHNSGDGGNVYFKAVKRAVPTITKYGNSSGLWSASGVFSGTVVPVLISSNGFGLNQQVVAAAVNVQGHYTADAEL